MDGKDLYQVVRLQSLPGLFSARVSGLVGCQPRAAGGLSHHPKSLSENVGHKGEAMARGGERQTADIL